LFDSGQTVNERFFIIINMSDKMVVATNGNSTLNDHIVTFQDSVDQAEICCEQARLAARCRRFKAACGLFTTAASLYRHAMSLDGISYPALERRLQDIELELSVYSELAKSMARPLFKSAGQDVSSDGYKSDMTSAATAPAADLSVSPDGVGI